jgi:glycine/D-amino acid oxidase-like deaminating enzyme
MTTHALLDPDDTHSDLRGGMSPWRRGLSIRRSRLEESLRCEVLIVGAGITGAILAEHLTARGHEVCIIDREEPGFGSTAASTSMLMWEIDRSLRELTELYGFSRAAAIYRRSFAAVSDLRGRMAELGVPLVRPRASLYVAGGEAGHLKEECGLRQRASLPSEFLGRTQLHEAFDIDRPCAIVSQGSADADPLLLAHALMRLAVDRGARLIDADAQAYHPSGDTVVVELNDRLVIEANHVVLATGYVMPDLVTSDLHDIASTWAIATVPQEQGRLWRGGALVWEAAANYLYARTTDDGRIVAGGEDERGLVEQHERDALTPAKTQALTAKLASLWPPAQAVADYAWSGVFSTTKDGLPLIGPVPGARRLYAAYGYGGNGITFSFVASRMVAEQIAGRGRDWFADFALDRDAPAAMRNSRS